MKFLPLLKTCIKSLRSNPMRASLTILGIIIGIAAVIALMEIGRGSTMQIQSTVQSMGADTLNIYPHRVTRGGVRSSWDGQTTIVPEDAEVLMNECPTVLYASPVMRLRGAQIVYGNINWRPNRVEGGNEEYLKIRNWDEVEQGQAYTQEDVLLGNRVCLLGQTIVKEVFGDIDPIGEEIRIKDVGFKVIGVLKKKGANMGGWDQDDTVLIPWSSIRVRLQGLGGGTPESPSSSFSYNRGNTYALNKVDYYPANKDIPFTSAPHPRRFNNVDYIMVKMRNPERSSESVDEITEVLRHRHGLTEGEPDDFDIRDMAEISKAMSSTSETMGQLLLIVAAISLVVGGVGIMNIMLVSVTERTREIGLRMSLGAKASDILRQFLLEAVLLCLVGGIFGIGIGRIASIIVSKYAGWPTMIVPEAMLLAVGVSAGIGIIFGWYPAWKASKLDPIDALRHE